MSDQTNSDLAPESHPEPHRNTLAPCTIISETRIRDIDLGERLGFSKAADIRKLIKRHESSLIRMGVIATVAKTPLPTRAAGLPSSTS